MTLLSGVGPARHLEASAKADGPVKGCENDLGSRPRRNIGSGFPQGSQQIVPERMCDPYRPKRFSGVQSRVPLHAEEHRGHQAWLGVASVTFGNASLVQLFLLSHQADR